MYHRLPMLHALILAGGSGKRFWPLSRRATPKQLLAIAGKRTMIAETVARLRGLVPPSRVHVLTNRSTVAAMRKALPGVPARQIVGEPEGRDTTAAIGLGAALVASRDPDGVMVVLPADHVIEPAAAFRRTLAAAADAAKREGGLYVFGVKPNHPATGYGYIQRGPALTKSRGVRVFKVKRFVEKPDLATAKRYVADGGFLWNAGIFCWRASDILAAIAKYKPAIGAALEKIRASKGSPAVLNREFPRIEKISIDYAVMEKAPDVRMLEAAWGWDDVGSWTSVAAYLKRDAAGNSVAGDFRGVDVSNCLVLSDGHLVAAVGVRDLIIVRTKDATLVCHRDRAQDVKKLVDLLEAEKREAVL
ncbi:MAG: NTP transferase domain-containing protein [Planctomycetes bacterium]|nr:NTP transferase domain-containing protein [Planctomycetota bacterium]